jgi:RHS repeat-associated protein
VQYTSTTGSTTIYVYDITAGIPSVLEESTQAGTVYYVRAPGGGLIARVSGTDVKYYGFDDLGSTLFLTDSTGLATDKYTYDAWGNVTSRTGSTQQPYQYVGAMGYYTHYQDANLPLLQLGVRFYDPSIGRFTQVDPIGDGINWYAYCENNPLMRVDPRGLKLK